MSADNGVYILKTLLPPIKNGNMYTGRHGYEYRVAHCMAIDNLYWHDLYAVVYFGNSKVFDNEIDAQTEAELLAYDIQKHGPLEYGIQTLEFEYYFPRMTVEAASEALDVYVDESVVGATLGN